MNYNKHYQFLIERAKNRELHGYFEYHHVIPKCLGGSNNKDNIVALTPEEHYVAHQLLLKMNPGNRSLLYAANMMVAGRPNQERNNKAYGWLRKRMSTAMSEMLTGKPSHNKGKTNLRAKKRMLESNPMKNPEVAKRVAEKLKGKSPPNKITKTKIWNCEECGKQHEELDLVHNNKRFCNKSCAASWFNKHRRVYKKLS